MEQLRAEENGEEYRATARALLDIGDTLFLYYPQGVLVSGRIDSELDIDAYNGIPVHELKDVTAKEAATVEGRFGKVRRETFAAIVQHQLVSVAGLNAQDAALLVKHSIVTYQNTYIGHPVTLEPVRVATCYMNDPANAETIARSITVETDEERLARRLTVTEISCGEARDPVVFAQSFLRPTHNEVFSQVTRIFEHKHAEAAMYLAAQLYRHYQEGNADEAATVETALLELYGVKDDQLRELFSSLHVYAETQRETERIVRSHTELVQASMEELLAHQKMFLGALNIT